MSGKNSTRHRSYSLPCKYCINIVRILVICTLKVDCYWRERLYLYKEVTIYIWNLACPSNVPCRLKLIFIASKLNCNPDHVSINILLQIEWISFQHWHIFWQIFQIKQPVWSLMSCRVWLMDQFEIFENKIET